MSKARLFEAVSTLDLEATKELLAAKPELLASTDRQGRNLLHLACSVPCGDLKIPEALSARMVRFLLDSGLDIESTPVGGDRSCTVLWFAVARGRNETLVTLLITRGARPTGLYAAGWFEDLHILDLLLRAGAPIDVVAGGETPFLFLWKNRRFAAAKRLITKGADANARDDKGRTALRIGIDKDYDPALLAFLVTHGASPDVADRDGVSPRARAARKRDKRFAEALA